MGFFSWNCKVCGHPLLSDDATTEKNEWMNHGVALLPDDSIIRGEYDGYGRLNDENINESGEPEVYHSDCWNLVGKPKKYTESSNSAADQGYFFDDEVHNFSVPKTIEEVQILRVVSKLHNKIHADTWMIARLECLIRDAESALLNDGENKEDILKNIQDHIVYSQKKEDKRLAENLGLSYEGLVELKGYFKALMEKNGERDERWICRFVKAEKLRDGVFRLTNGNDLCFDQDFINDKVYMVYDPYEIIEPGTERSEWEYHKEEV